MARCWKDFCWVQAAPHFPTKPLVPCSINTEQHWGTLASPPMLGEPWRFREKTNNKQTTNQHPHVSSLSSHIPIKYLFQEIKKERRMSLLLSSDGQILGITGLLLPLDSAATGANQAKGAPASATQAGPPYNCLGPGSCFHEAGGAGHT